MNEKDIVKSLFENASTLDIKEQQLDNLSYLKDESKLLELIKLIPNEKNRVLNGANVLDLARNIRLNGLLQYPIVTPNGDGTYKIIAGHNRIAACKINVERYGEKKFEKIRCIIKANDEINNELMMIDTNLNIDSLSPYDMMVAIGRKEELLKLKKKQGDFKGNLKDILVEESNLQRSQIQTYLTIYKKGCTAVHNDLMNKRINLAQALKISKSPKEEQKENLIELHDKRHSIFKKSEKDFNKLFKSLNDALLNLNDHMFMLSEELLTDKQKDLKEVLRGLKTVLIAFKED